MPTPRARLGKWGEELTSGFLRQKGYTILDSNYRCTWGEVDIVARDGEELVFVEVRTRRGAKFGTPQESLTARKSRRLIATAQDYLQNHDAIGAHWRIDLVSILLDQGGRVEEISHLRHAVQE